MTTDAWTRAAEEHARLRKIADAAEEFIRAHCALEELARKLGPNAATSSGMTHRVIELHERLEQLVLGEEKVPGRRTPCQS